jgi:hypothetical protein
MLEEVKLKLNGTHQLFVYADDVDLLGDNTNTRKKNTQILIDDSKEIGLEVNVERTNYAGKVRNIYIYNTSFQNVSQFGHF